MLSDFQDDPHTATCSPSSLIPVPTRMGWLAGRTGWERMFNLEAWEPGGLVNVMK